MMKERDREWWRGWDRKKKVGNKWGGVSGVGVEEIVKM
jgi:hypothetical protein